MRFRWDFSKTICSQTKWFMQHGHVTQKRFWAKHVLMHPWVDKNNKVRRACCKNVVQSVKLRLFFGLLKQQMLLWETFKTTVCWKQQKTGQNRTPRKMSLESLSRVLWHFWRYVECFSDFSESTGTHFKAFWKRTNDFFETSKKICHQLRNM